MKIILVILVLCAASCSTYRCYPSPRSKDYATIIKLTGMSNGWTHAVAAREPDRFVAYYECLPDSVHIGATVWVGNYKRLRTGGRMQINIIPGVNNNKGISNL